MGDIMKGTKFNASGLIMGTAIVFSVIVVIIVVLYALGNINININIPSGYITNIQSPSGSLPQTDYSCSYYNFRDEFYKYFGVSNMLTLSTACNNANGTWLETNNEVSCQLPSNVLLDCSDNRLHYISDLCSALKGTYVCHTYYVGCVCNKQTPSGPIPVQNDSGGNQGGDQYTCGWHSVALVQQQCGGTCPTGKYCEVVGQDCKCVSPSEEAGVGTIIVSSLKWTGAMGGLKGADAKCQQSAINAGLTGTWKAVMSDSSTSATSRLPNIPYYNMNGLLVANNKADLFDGTIANFVNIDENGNVIASGHVWTGSKSDGTPVNPGDLNTVCHNWGWVSDGYFGGIGELGSNGVAWLSMTTIDECKVANRLYCARIS